MTQSEISDDMTIASGFHKLITKLIKKRAML